MTDFVDVLEQQLREAHGRPERFVPPWRTGMVLAAAAGAAALVVALIVGLASPDAQHGAPTPAQQTTPPQTTPVHPVAPATIAVLNGTTVTGLGRAAADQLTANGYGAPLVVTTDTTNQSRRVSEVFYEEGHRNEAFSVAACLEIRFDHVHAMNANARTLADRADVAVFLGSDRTP
jgi:hypothetical protein